MGITVVTGSATIGVTEFWLASNSTTKTDQTDDADHQDWVDFGNMAAGDVYEWRLVEKVNAGTQRDVLVGRIVGAQSSPLIVTGFLLAEGWELGVKKISGTDRVINWSIRKVA